MVAFAQMPEHNPNIYVTDQADVLTKDEENLLDKKIRGYMRKSSIEMTVVTLNTLDGKPIEDYANELFKKWGIGKKGLNNGLLVLFVPSERKWRIEVGYGLEPYLPDGYTKQIGDGLMKPQFKQKKYFAGIDALLSAFIEHLGPETLEQRHAYEAKKAKEDEEASAAATQVALFVFGFIFFSALVVLLIVYQVRKKRREEKERQDKINRIAQLKLDISTVDDKLEGLKRTVTSITNKKYVKAASAALLTKIVGVEKEIKDLSELSSDSEDGLVAIKNKAYSIFNSLNSEYNECSKNMAKLVDAEKVHNNIPSILNSTQQDMNSAKMKAGNLKKKAAEFNITNTFASLDIDGEAIERRREEFVSKIKTCDNLLEKYLQNDDVVSSVTKASEINVLVNELRIMLSRPHNATVEMETKISRFNSDVSGIDLLVSKALKESKDSDVSSTTKSRIRTATDNLINMKSLAGTNPFVNGPKLNTAISEVDNLIRKAKDEQDYAEKERRRKKREEEEEEESRRRRNSSSSYSSGCISSSSSSSDYSSSSSSSDFGGGDSGGGGSSGDW